MKAVIFGLLIPFLGTAAGAACVLFLKKDLRAGMQRALTGHDGAGRGAGLILTDN